MITTHNRDEFSCKQYSFALVGNPNVGKSTMFNALTGDNQHTGNWSGKTVDICKKQVINRSNINLTDLPGTYSLYNNTPEEKITRDYLLDCTYDCLIIVVNSLSLERNLMLVLQVLSEHDNVVLCLNMSDELKKKNILLDTDELTLQLGIPVINISALHNRGLNELLNKACCIADNSIKTYIPSQIKNISELTVSDIEKSEHISELCHKIKTVVIKSESNDYTETDKKLDKVFTSKITGLPIMIMLFAFIFWLTAFGANYPSQWLSYAFAQLRYPILNILEYIRLPQILINILLDGVYTTVSWVVSVMLPPALIFFPLFAILEESGYLPRVAFVLDRIFSKAGVNGKLSITMLMGLGCNACGVMGCRIVKSKKERIISAITNSFIPCNGRFPTLIAIINVFIAGNFTGINKSLISAGSMILLLIMSFLLTLLMAWVFSKLFLKNDDSSFIMELPSYKKPELRIILPRILKEKVLFVLTRAIAVSAPAGVLIWLVTNIHVANLPIIEHITVLLNPFALLIGLDGVILVAYILGFPANEIVLPIILMLYQNNSVLTEYSSVDVLGSILKDNGWTIATAICVCMFCLFHFPCATTCMTIKKETGSIFWTVISIILPLTIGILICFIISSLFALLI